MYVIDQNLVMSDNQAIPSSAGTAYSTNVLHLQGHPETEKFGQGLGKSADYVNVKIVDPAAGGTSLKVDVETADNEAFSSPTVVASSAIVALASLTAGADVLTVSLPPVMKAYVRLKYTTVGMFTGGTILGYIGTKDNQ